MSGSLLYRLALGILGVWRITHLLQAEDGPWDLVVRLRRAAGDGFWGGALDCFQCLSLWIALPFALLLGSTLLEKALLFPALSGAAILLQRIPIPTPAAPSAAGPHWKEEETDVVLRTKAASSGQDAAIR